jgi:anaerobic ribonucleoside-triphosphate reductase activating protein
MEDGMPTSSRALALEIILSEAEGLTISGGEPFLQAEALMDMITHVRKERDLGVIVYTGYTLDELTAMQSAHVANLLNCVDLLIDGAYISELNDGVGLRGSSNQNIVPLTERYAGFLEHFRTSKRNVEVISKRIETRYVGIPTGYVLSKVQCTHNNNEEDVQ